MSDIKRLINEYEDDNFDIENTQEVNLNPVDEKLIDLVEHQLKNRLTMRGTVECAKLLNSMPNSDFQIPETKKQ